jgi:hypothetical protein
MQTTRQVQTALRAAQRRAAELMRQGKPRPAAIQLQHAMGLRLRLAALGQPARW